MKTVVMSLLVLEISLLSLTKTQTPKETPFAAQLILLSLTRTAIAKKDTITRQVGVKLATLCVLLAGVLQLHNVMLA